MGAPHVHAELSARRFGGQANDYIAIHELMDSSKIAFPDLRHRTLTHNSWFVTTVLEKIFGNTIKNSDEKNIAVREIGQWHVMEDYGGSFPSVQDFLQNMSFQTWMNNGENGDIPPSNVGLPLFDKSLLDPKLPVPRKLPKYILEGDTFEEIGDRGGRGCGGGGRLD